MTFLLLLIALALPAILGIALIMGTCVRLASVGGIALLALYYLAQPPFMTNSAEGHFLFVDRNVVEAIALLFTLGR